MKTSPALARPGERLRLSAAWLVLLAGAAATAFMSVQTVPQSFNGQRSNDFPNYYIAGLRMWEGRPIYKPHAEEVRTRLGFADYRTNIADSPVAVVVLAPLSRLPYRAAFFCLYFFSLLAVPGAVYGCARALKAPPWEALTAAGLTLFSNHYRFVLVFNHMESLVLCLLAGGWICLRSGKERVGAALWGAAAALKLFPGLLLVLLVVQRRWRAALWGMATAAAMLLLAGMAIGWTNALEFVTQVIPHAGTWYGRDYNVSLMSITSRTADPAAGWAISLAALAVAAVVTLRSRRDADALLMAGSAGMLLASPLSWIGYGILLMPALVAASKRTAPRDVGGGPILVTALVLSQFWPFQTGPETPLLGRFLFYSVPPAAGYALVLLLAALKRTG
jgi:hypothetical protein